MTDPIPSSQNRVREIAAFLFVVAIAAFARFYRVTALPTGFHGDEGVVGMEAQRVLREGYIGFYSTLGGGYPTGPVYFNAPFVWLFGNTIIAMRLLPALLGTITVIALYFFVRRNHGARVALLAAALLAVLNWHIHFSRIGFPLIIWPLCAVITAAFVMEAVRRHRTLWWALAGAVTASGIYMYNAHPLFAGVTGLFVALHLARLSIVDVRRRAAWMAAFTGGAVAVALPMILYALNPANGYFTHFRRDSLFQNPQWQTLEGIGPKIGFLIGRYITFWDAACWHPRIDDGVDVTGVAPIIQPLLLLLALIGIWHGLRVRRDALTLYGLLVIGLMPLGAVFTIGGLARRPFALAPFLVMFAALGVVEIIRRTRGGKFERAGMVAAACVCAFVVWQNLDGYFRRVANSREQYHYYAEEFTDAVKWMKTLPPDSYVYFASERWTLNHETRRFLAPEVRGEDRSSQFGGDQFNQLGFQIEPEKGKPVFLLIGEYRTRLNEIQRLYPRGETIVRGTAERPTFVAYIPTL